MKASFWIGAAKGGAVALWGILFGHVIGWLLLLAMMLTGCTGLRVYQQSVRVAGKDYTATRLAGNLGGPGLSCLMIHNLEGQVVWVSPACASGPDAGVALATAGMQGAGVALGAAVLGASYPANKASSVTAAGGSGGSGLAGATTVQSQAQGQAQSSNGGHR